MLLKSINKLELSKLNYSGELFIVVKTYREPAILFGYELIKEWSTSVALIFLTTLRFGIHFFLQDWLPIKTRDHFTHNYWQVLKYTNSIPGR